MNDFFKELQDKINKKVKGAHASVMSESKIATDRFSVMTPCYDLNRILSGSLRSGIKSRNLMGIIGPEHTMKSSFHGSMYGQCSKARIQAGNYRY
jgi:Asp/Glu/hydantoin racemase